MRSLLLILLLAAPTTAGEIQWLPPTWWETALLVGAETATALARTAGVKYVVALLVLLAGCANGVEVLPDGGVVCPPPTQPTYCGSICPGADKVTREMVCGSSYGPVPCDGGTPSFVRVGCWCYGVGGFAYYDTIDQTLCAAAALTWLQIQCPRRDGG